MSQINAHRVAKNSIFLYIRMLLSMVLSLWSTRIILKALGIEDFGIYNVVGGIVVMLSVVSGSLSASISRYITYELGHGDTKKLKSVFKTSLIIQILIGACVFILAETVGLWFLNAKMNIPANQLTAANWVYQFSVAAFIVDLISVPYNAAIIAYERMKVFAYVGVLTSIAKLGVAFALLLFISGRLIIYAGLIFAISVIVRIFYGFYCAREFPEIQGASKIDKNLFKEIFAFASWNFIGSTAGILRDQGLNIVLNLFFGPIVNAARGIAMQVSAAATTFANNFMIALNPQITKSYASADIADSIKLAFTGSRLGYFLMYIIALPIIIETPFILKLWLGNVPEYSVIFVRLILINSLIDVLSNTLMTLMLATGNIRNYQLVVGGCNLLILPIAYFVLFIGYDAASALWVSIVISCVALILRLYLLSTMTQLSIMDFIKNVGLRVMLTSAFAFVLPGLYISAHQSVTITDCINTCLISIGSCILFIYLVGLNQYERLFVVNKVKRLIIKN